MRNQLLIFIVIYLYVMNCFLLLLSRFFFVFDFQQFGYDASRCGSPYVHCLSYSGLVQLLGSISHFFPLNLRSYGSLFLKKMSLPLFLLSLFLGPQLHLCYCAVSRYVWFYFFFNFLPSVHQK